MCQCGVYAFVYMRVLIRYNIKLYSHTCKHANALMHTHIETYKHTNTQIHTRTRVYMNVDYMTRRYLDNDLKFSLYNAPSI